MVNAADARNIYELPLILHDEGLDEVVCDVLRLDAPIDLSPWEVSWSGPRRPSRPVRIGLIGKYVALPDAYLSVAESLRHAGFHHEAKVEIDWIQAEDVEGLLAAGRLSDLDGMVIAGGFGVRGIEGKIAAATTPASTTSLPRPVPRACRSWPSSSPATCSACRAPTPASSTRAARTR